MSTAQSPQSVGVGHPDRFSWIEWAVALLGTGIALILYLVFLNNAGALWRDEVNTVNTATAPSLSAMWRLMEFESFPIFWLLLLRGWVHIGAGATDGGLRLLGLLGGFSLLAAVWFAALRLSHRPPGVSLAFIAINPDIIRWAATVRAWGLGAALAIVTFVLIREAIHRDRSRRSVVIATVAGILGVQLVYQNAVFVGAMVAGVVVVTLTTTNWKRAASPIAIGVAAAISLIPYAEVIRRRGEWNVINATHLTILDVSTRCLTVISGSGRVVLDLWIGTVAAALFLAAASAWFSWRTRGASAAARSGGDSTATYAGVVLIVAAVGIAILYLSFAYPTAPWYYLGLIALIGVCADAALAPFVRTAGPRVFLAILMLVVIGFGFRHAWASLRQPMTNLNLVGTRLNSDASRDDLILTVPWFYVMPLDRYYHGDAEVMTIPPLEDHKVHRYDLLKRSMLSSNPLAPVLSRIQHTLESGHRVWIVGNIKASELRPHPLGQPPLPDTGWSVWPYMDSWAFETKAFVAEHALYQAQIPVDPGGPHENASLVIVSGWRR